MILHAGVRWRHLLHGWPSAQDTSRAHKQWHQSMPALKPGPGAMPRQWHQHGARRTAHIPYDAQRSGPWPDHAPANILVSRSRTSHPGCCCSPPCPQVYKQKVKHLLYEHQATVTTLKADGEMAIKLQQDDFRRREGDLGKDKRVVKGEMKEAVRAQGMAGVCVWPVWQSWVARALVVRRAVALVPR